MPEIFNYWLQGGRIDVGFLGAAQIDRYGNLNSTVIGDYDQPKVRLPGGGGAPEIAAMVKEVIVIIRQSQRTFVDRIHFRSSVPGSGAMVVITDLGVLRLDPRRARAGAHARPSRGAGRTGAVGDRLGPARGGDLAETEPPGDEELRVLRGSAARSRRRPA